MISPDPAIGKVTVVLDGTHVRADRSGDKDGTGRTIRARRRRSPSPPPSPTPKKGPVAQRNDPRQHPRYHAAQEDPPVLGILTRIMAKYDTPDPDRLALYVDKGYQGIPGYYLSAIIRQQARRRPNSDRHTGGLTKGDLALNKEINGTRIVVEHAIGMIKRYRVPPSPSGARPRSSTTRSTSSSGW